MVYRKGSHIGIGKYTCDAECQYRTWPHRGRTRRIVHPRWDPGSAGLAYVLSVPAHTVADSGSHPGMICRLTLTTPFQTCCLLSLCIATTVMTRIPHRLLPTPSPQYPLDYAVWAFRSSYFLHIWFYSHYVHTTADHAVR